MAIKIAVIKKGNVAKAKSTTPTAGTIVQGKVTPTPTPTDAPATTKPKVTKASKQAQVASTPTTTAKKTTKKVSTPTPTAKNVTAQDLKELVVPFCREALEAKDAYDLSKKDTDKLKKVYDGIMNKVTSALKGVDIAPTHTFKVSDGTSTISVGIAQVTRTINSQREVFKQLEAIDPELPWKLLSFKVGDLDKYLGKHQLDALVTENQTPRRTLTVSADE